VDPRDDLLDQLVPAPWSSARRALGAAVATSLVAIGGLGWWAGLLGPNVRPLTGWTAGSDPDRAVVELQLDVHNRGWLPLHDVTLELPDDIGAVVADPVAERLGPGETATATFTVPIEHCDDLRTARGTELDVRARSGLVTASRTLVPGSGTGSTLAATRGGLATLLEPVCDAAV
jgi:hypothetical protein